MYIYIYICIFIHIYIYIYLTYKNNTSVLTKAPTSKLFLTDFNIGSPPSFVSLLLWDTAFPSVESNFFKHALTHEKH